MISEYLRISVGSEFCVDDFDNVCSYDCFWLIGVFVLASLLAFFVPWPEARHNLS